MCRSNYWSINASQGERDECETRQHALAEGKTRRGRIGRGRRTGEKVLINMMEVDDINAATRNVGLKPLHMRARMLVMQIGNVSFACTAREEQGCRPAVQPRYGRQRRVVKTNDAMSGVVFSLAPATEVATESAAQASFRKCAKNYSALFYDPKQPATPLR